MMFVPTSTAKECLLHLQRCGQATSARERLLPAIKFDFIPAPESLQKPCHAISVYKKQRHLCDLAKPYRTSTLFFYPSILGRSCLVFPGLGLGCPENQNKQLYKENKQNCAHGWYVCGRVRKLFHKKKDMTCSAKHC